VVAPWKHPTPLGANTPFTAQYKPPQQAVSLTVTPHNSIHSGTSSTLSAPATAQPTPQRNIFQNQQTTTAASVASALVAPASPLNQSGLASSGVSSGKDGSRVKSIVKIDNTYTNAFTQSPDSSSGQTQSHSNVVWSNSTSKLMGGTGVSGGGLIANYCCVGASSTVWASKGVSHGKHYWELMLSTRPGEQHADTWTASGVSDIKESTAGEAQVFAPVMTNTAGALAVPVGRDKNIINGDTLMFALDADRRIAYWGVNGQWRNGEPGNYGGTDLELAQGAVFKAFATLSASSSKNTPEGDRWIANFGSKPFRYPLPSGFDSYGAR